MYIFLPNTSTADVSPFSTSAFAHDPLLIRCRPHFSAIQARNVICMRLPGWFAGLLVSCSSCCRIQATFCWCWCTVACRLPFLASLLFNFSLNWRIRQNSAFPTSWPFSTCHLSCRSFRIWPYHLRCHNRYRTLSLTMSTKYICLVELYELTINQTINCLNILMIKKL